MGVKKLNLDAVGQGSTAHQRYVASIVAHLPGVRKAVHSDGREIRDRAKALFAEHNRPGGHEIRGAADGIDYVVSIEGEVPHVIEFGRAGYTRDDGAEIGPMEGLHILGRAVES